MLPASPQPLPPPTPGQFAGRSGSTKPPLRVVHALVQLAEAFGEKTAQGMRIVYPPLQDLADISQVSREAAAAVLGRLQQQGVIQVLPEQQSLLLVQYAKLVEASCLL